MSNQRRFTIGTVVAAIVMLALIGVFVAHDMNAPVQEVRVYELPTPSDSPPAVDQLTPGKTERIAFDQQSQGSDTTVVQYSVESDQGYEGTAALGEIEPCCPDEADSYPEGDMDFGQDTNFDHNPVSPEVIEAGRRHAEYWDAFLRHHEKVVASKEEMDALIPQLNAFMEDNRDLDQLRRNMQDPAYRAKMEALAAKLKALQKRDEQLANQFPTESSYAH